MTGAPPLAAESDEQARESAARFFGIEVEDEILDGGSPARVYRARAGDGGLVALKVLVGRSGVVDGHDMDAFVGKLAQLDRIRALAPVLGARYLPVLAGARRDGWAAQVTPYYESEDAAACLRLPGGEDRFFRQYDAILTDLVLNGYAVAPAPVAPDHQVDINFGRFLRRWEFLARALPPALAGAETLVVNGRPCRSPGAVIRGVVSRRPPWLARLGPVRLGLPAHGDANTRNVLIDRAGSDEQGRPDFRLIDPRGSVAPWDPVYDLAKIVFSLTVWDPALRLGFSIRPTGHGDPPEYEVSFRCPTYDGYRAAIRRFMPWLGSSAGLMAAFDGDAGWRDRLLLTHALHVLAEAPCRLSDPKPKWDCEGRRSPAETLALGHYLLGALLVDDLVDRLDHGEVDVTAHLGLVSEGLPAG